MADERPVWLCSATMTIGDRLRQRLVELDMRPAELARLLGESPQRIGQYLNNVRRPDKQMTARLANALGVTPAYLGDVERIDPAVMLAAVKRVCELAGMPEARAAIVAEASLEATRLLSSLPDGADEAARIGLAAHAAWNSTRRPARPQ